MAKQLQELRTTLTLDKDSFSRSAKETQSDLRALRSEMNFAKASTGKYDNSLTGLRKQSDILNRTLTVQRQRLESIKKRYDESVKATGANSAESRRLQAQYNNVAAQIKKTENNLVSINGKIDEQTNKWKVLSTRAIDVGDSMKNAGDKMTAFGRNMTMRVTTPILGLGGAMLKTGVEFESSMSNVQAISGATGSDLEKLEDKARELGATTSKSASEAADALGYMALAGWDTTQMMSGLEPVLRLSEAGNVDLARASDLVTDSMSALQIEVKDLPQYLDNVAEASRSSNTSIDQLMQAYVTAGGNLAQFNVPLDESTALLGLLANRGLKGSEAGRALNAIMVNLTSGAGQAGTALEELEISAFDADGQFIGLEETLNLVKDRTKDMTDEQRAQYISMIAGKEHLKSFQGLLAGIDDEYGDLKDSVSDADGALDNMAKTMQDNAQGNINRLKSSFEELSIQFSEHVLPAFTRGVEKVTDLVDWFGSLDKSTQDNIIKMAGLTAAIGPVSMVLGGVTRTAGSAVGTFGRLAGAIGKKGDGAGKASLVGGLGSLTKAFGTASGSLGKVGGKGLLGGLASLGLRGGVVGLAVTTVGALGVGLYNLHKEMQVTNEEVIKSIDSRKKEIDTLDNLVGKFETLQNKNKLSTDEMLRYMDIATELKNAKTEEAIKALTDEQEELLKKSTLSNDEMEEFLKLNGKIVENTPDTVKAISEQGNAYVGVIDKVKELNEAEKNRLIDDTYESIKEGLDEHKQSLEQQREIQQEIKDLESERTNALSSVLDYNTQIQEKDLEIAGVREQIKTANDEEAIKLGEKLVALESERSVLDSIREKHNQEIEKLDTKLTKKQDSLDKNKKEIEDFEIILGEYEALILNQVGLNTERGKGLEALDREIAKQLEIRNGLDEQKKKGELTTQEYNKRVQEAQSEIDKLREAKRELQNINTIADSGIYESRARSIEKEKLGLDEVKRRATDINSVLGKKVDKDVNINPSPSISDLDKDLGRGISRTLTIEQVYQNAKYPFKAEGTSYFSHPTGKSWLGEEGAELVRHGNKWALADFGLYNVPHGAQIYTHEETKKILNAVNKYPKHATGASPTGEADRIANRLSEPTTQTINFNGLFNGATINVRNEQDIEDIAKKLHNLTKTGARSKGVIF